MKNLWMVLLILSYSSLALGKKVTIDDAPLEWLIANTLKEKTDFDGHLHKSDPLVNSIFDTINYNPHLDEIILTSNKKTHQLKADLIEYLKKNQNKALKKQDETYIKWKNEGLSSIPVTLWRTNQKVKGHYYFNHIHTDISQDNEKLEFLKISPRKTYTTLRYFLKNRNSTGTVAFTDHDTDKAYDQILPHLKPELAALRGVEWGGRTHMGLVGIKKNWEELPNGRNYREEESIRKSRSSQGFRIVNHPNRKGPFHYSSWLDADGVEVWNTLLENSPFLKLKIKRSNNKKALKQWTEALSLGKRYTAVAGSDFHFIVPCLKERSLVYPVNFIPSPDKHKTEQFLHEGRVSFITRPDAPKLTLQAKYKSTNQWSPMGSQVSGSGSLNVRLFGDFSDTNKRIGGYCYNTIRTFWRLFTFWKRDYWEIRFYNKSGDLIAKRSLRPHRYNSKKHFKAEFEFPSKSNDLIRAELWQVNRRSKSIDLLGATNPIYIKQQ
jgi:hypothetical protein